MKNIKRRKFIKDTAQTLTIASIPNVFNFIGKPFNRNQKSESVKFGFITDLHHGFAKNTLPRLDAFIQDATNQPLDFIIQGGDFCFSEPAAQECIDLWNTYNGEKYHVLGNHDMDKGTKEDIMEMWGMEQKYYSFDQGAFHFVVLDANYILENGEYKDYANANFYIDQENRSLVNPEQIEWLKEDLAKTDKQTIIISHQAFDEIWDGWSSPSRFEVRKVIDEANNNFEFQKVIACFCGHHHVDEHSLINNVHYFQMNSATYYYSGEGFGSDGALSIYSEPLYAFVRISTDGTIAIEGKQGQFVHPTPKDKHHKYAPRLTASILDKNVKFKER